MGNIELNHAHHLSPQQLKTLEERLTGRFFQHLNFLMIINYRLLTTETNLKALYISLFVHNLITKAICSECTDFCLQLHFSKKGKNKIEGEFEL